MKDGTCEDRLQCEERIGVKQGCIEFMKRCCLAYLNERKQRLQTFRWKFGEVLPSDIKANLCQAEMDWFNQYTTMLAEYQGSVGENGVNLMTNMKPPKSLFTQVRAIEDYGEFETSDGTVVLLKKNSVVSYLEPSDFV
ncbi:unnamed protein product [Anisakis simplex]|uniref:DNA replication complex GINS protein PSF1 n=1 Tax=Anisakis simplex TaxID=6269 RepID=A0A0M3JY47_ANISI|nr:unnamed protein product [Anisakis simplex]